MSLPCKTFEVRDAATFIPCFAILCAPYEIDILLRGAGDQYLLRRAGYGHNACVLFGRLNGGQAFYDPADWGDRTMRAAHDFVADHFDQIMSGSVVDVRVILGEQTEPARSESYG